MSRDSRDKGDRPPPSNATPQDLPKFLPCLDCGESISVDTEMILYGSILTVVRAPGTNIDACVCHPCRAISVQRDLRWRFGQ